jgi:hypothetical protein
MQAEKFEAGGREHENRSVGESLVIQREVETETGTGALTEENSWRRQNQVNDTGIGARGRQKINRR